MRHELADYLAEFELAPSDAGGLSTGTSPSFPGSLPGATVLPGGTGGPTLPLLSRSMPAVYVRDAEATAAGLIGSGVLPAAVPRGSTPIYIPPPPPPAPPSTAQAWTTLMWAEKSRIDGLVLEVDRLRNAGVRKTARGENPDAHIQNNYTWREHRIPATGLCDPAKLVWLDIWFRARAILERMATPPLRGVPGEAIRVWALNIGKLVSLIVESTNTRFFDAPFSVYEAMTKVAGVHREAPGAATAPVEGLANIAQGNGGYYYNTRGDTASPTDAMQFAPVPSGGYEELFSGARAAWLRPRPVWICLDVPHCQFSFGASVQEGIWTDPWRQVLDQAFAAWGASGQTVFSGLTATRGNPGGPLRRFQLDTGAFVSNVLNLARVMSDARLSFGQVFMRSTNFYVNAYLDYAGQRGVVATDVVNNARNAWAGIRSEANNALNSSVATTLGAIVAVATAINAAAGAIIGVVAGLLSALIAAEGAAVGYGPTVPEPFYWRVFGGSCASSAWLPGPVAAPPTRAVPSPDAPIPTPEDREPDVPPPEPKKGGGVLAIGALGLGLWLLAGKR